MAGRGFPPREGPTLGHHAPPATTTLDRTDRLSGFPLPAGVLPGAQSWHPVTVRWWESWRRSPQAQAMADTDWSFLLDTALMHQTMWARGRWDFAAEVRLRVARVGATIEDRMRLRMTIPPDPDEPEDRPVPGTVTDLDARRHRLSNRPNAGA